MMLDEEDEGEMSDKTTKSALFSSFLALVLCCALLMGLTFAWFTDTVSTGSNRVESASYRIEVIVNESEEELEEKGAGFVYVCPATESDSHTFQVKASGTATKGYCEIIVVSGEVTSTVYSEQMYTDGVAVEVTLYAPEGSMITFYPHWGAVPNSNVTP